MQDFKTAHLLGVCPRAQFAAMLLGSAVSAGVSVAAYSLYTSAWQVRVMPLKFTHCNLCRQSPLCYSLAADEKDNHLNPVSDKQSCM